MLYVAEIFNSIQGEGGQVGLPSLFVRLAGCNMRCLFCDTDHNQNSILTPSELATIIVARCINEGLYNVVITGGEPLLQIEEIRELITICNDTIGFVADFALETNGSIAMPVIQHIMFKHVSMSPKQPFSHTMLKTCSSLKLLYPFVFPENDFTKFYHGTSYGDIFLIPLEDPNAGRLHSTKQTIEKVSALHRQGFTRVKLGVQLHKYLGLE